METTTLKRFNQLNQVECRLEKKDAIKAALLYDNQQLTCNNNSFIFTEIVYDNWQKTSKWVEKKRGKSKELWLYAL